MAVTEPLLVLSDGLLVTRTHAARLIHGDAFPWLSALRRADAITIPLDARDDLIDTLLARQPPLADAPDELRIETVTGIPRPRLELRPISFRARSARRRPDVRLRGHLDPRRIDPAHRSSARRPARHPPRRRSRGTVPGDPPRTGLSRRLESRPGTAGAAVVGSRPPANHPAAARPGLAGRGRGPQLPPAGRRCSWTSSVRASTGSSCAVRSSTAASARRCPRCWPRSSAANRSSRWATARSACCRKSGCASTRPSPGSGRANGDGIRFKRSQVALLDALLAAQPEANVGRDVRARPGRAAGLRRHPADRSAARSPARCAAISARGSAGWCSCSGSASAAASPTTWGWARPSWSWRCSPHGASARRDGPALPSLVVAPRSLVFNWRQEAARFTPGLRVLEYSGAGRAALRDRFGDHDLVLTTYGTLRRDATALTGTRRSTTSSSTRRRRSRTPRASRPRPRGCSTAAIGWR